MTPLQMHNYCADVIGLDRCELARYGDDLIPRYYPPDYIINVPCGKCAQCLKSKRLGWSIRLIFELECHKESSFITLTFDDKNLKKFKSNPKRAIMLYIDRLRKHLGYRPRYFFVSELGDATGRLHFHGILFGTSKKELPFELQRDKWDYGLSWIGYCNAKTCNYIVKYLLKGSKGYKPVLLCSNGIGASYLKKSNLEEWHVNNFVFRDYIPKNGFLYPLPQYYSNKIYSDAVKVCKMLNRSIFDPFERSFLGVTYKDLFDYNNAIRKHYMWTIAHGLSEPVTMRKYTEGIDDKYGISWNTPSVLTPQEQLINNLKFYGLWHKNSFFQKLTLKSQNVLNAI